MALSSTEFKQLTYGFGRDLHDVKQHLYFALNGELSESERKEAIAAGEKKLTDYAKLLEQLEALQVQNARGEGWSWQDIAEHLGVSRQAVHKKYARRRSRLSRRA